MRVLVTGGAGFVGANLVRALIIAGHQVRILDNFTSGRMEHLDGLEIDVLAGDILSADTVQSAVAGMDSVVHLAAQTGVPGSLLDPRRDCEVNILGTLNLLEGCRAAGLRRFVFASSNAPLGRQDPPATEDMAPLPISPYGASKLAGEGYCLAYHGSWGLGTVVLRFANLYGPFSAHKNSVVARFFKDLLTSEAITIEGDGMQTRDFLYVEDLCHAIILALDSDVSGEVFQVATGIETSIAELASNMQDVTGLEATVHHSAPRRGDIKKNYSQISKIRANLDWEPQIDLGVGLAKTWEWFASQPLDSLK